MTSEEYIKLTSENDNVDLVRPFWNHEDYHKDIWKDVTVLICQRKTKDMTRLCLESLLSFYPEVPVLVVDGNSQDESSLYLKYKEATCDNVRVWNRSGINSHGLTMDEAIVQFIETEYVLLVDSDVVFLRPGFLEDMYYCLRDSDAYSIGTLMLVSYTNDACGPPRDFNDVLRYNHPSLSLIKRSIYLTLPSFTDHGAPCCYNMKEAQNKGLQQLYYPTDKYAAHLSGASWTDPKTIWSHDNGVRMRPVLTFINSGPGEQTIRWYDIIPYGHNVKDKVVVHDSDPIDLDNIKYDCRFYINGDYVCELDKEVSNRFVEDVIDEIIFQRAPDTLHVQGINIVKRQVWQRRNALR